MGTSAALTSGQLSRLSGVGRETLRFYEQRKLLPKPGRTLSGYRLYPPETVERLQFIQGAKSLGFSLLEIRELLGLDSAEVRSCDHVIAEAQAKLADVERRIQALQAMRLELKQTIGRCQMRLSPSACGPECLTGSKA